MEALLFLGLVAIAVLLVAGLMWRLRFEGQPPPLPPLVPAVILAVVVVLLGVALARGSWLTVGSFALLTVSWSAILFQAIRARRSAG
jgi:hypothetical protein